MHTYTSRQLSSYKDPQHFCLLDNIVCIQQEICCLLKDRPSLEIENMNYNAIEFDQEGHPVLHLFFF